MNIHEATRSYETWMRRRITVVPSDLREKHRLMAEAPFPFLRATFYRWMQLWPEICPELAKAPVVLAVGDLHVENFGTWRDADGRLNWGVNDFDEVYPLPYTIDLVRLAASAYLAIRAEHLTLKPKKACAALVDGYQEGLRSAGRPFVLAEHAGWLRELALSRLRDPKRFWKKLAGLAGQRNSLPVDARKVLEKTLPEPGLAYRIFHRRAGMGSLGRQRFVALAEWRGGKVAREVKALLPSACARARAEKHEAKIYYMDALRRAVRAPDPFLGVQGRWVVRRLFPDSCRIEIADLPAKRDELRIFEDMGGEVANVHLGSAAAIAAVRRDLARRGAEWLHAAAKAMARATLEDWMTWRRG